MAESAHAIDMEVLAPAGGPAALRAAVAAGADAVYLGLPQLNARRGAENFQPETLVDEVAFAHAHGTRCYLTLNIDLAQRELGQAARQLALAQCVGMDAVLVRDPALLALRPFFPRLEFHFSTQAGIATSAGMAAARDAGAARVVLARELTLAEIRAAAAVSGVAAEVFIQGALCFCASGRCLLSSWVGGRSGNRGTCTSPCRVPWARDGVAAGQTLSMHDLSLLPRLGALRDAGVRALKIEGRLKTPEWVSRAVGLYRSALAGTTTAELAATEANRLGAYTGRRMTSGYVDGCRTELTGEAGRVAASEGAPTEAPAADMTKETARPGLALRIAADGKGGLLWQLRLGPRTFEQRTPNQPVRNPAHSVTLAEAVARLRAALPRGMTLNEPAEALPPSRGSAESSADSAAAAARTPTAGAVELCDPDLRVPRSTANGFVREAAAFLRRADQEPDGTVRTALAPDVKQALAPDRPHPENCRMLGDAPDRVRIEATRAAAFAQAVPEVLLIVDDARAADLPDLVAAVGAERLLVALPPVLYENDLPGAADLVTAAQAAGLAVEVNSWDGWHLARSRRVCLEAGPGMMVLNALAAKYLRHIGCNCVTLSVEADRRQLEEAATVCPVPLSLVVFGRPPLLQTRVEAPPTARPGTVFEDARGVRMCPRREGSVTVFRPVEPYSLCDLRNPALRVAHLVADLNAAPDPLAAWRSLARPLTAPLRFNYERTLR